MRSSEVGVLIGTPGIGDAVWHLPGLRALATQRGPLTIFARGSAQAPALFGHEPLADRFVTFARRRGRALSEFVALAAAMRGCGLSEIWIFHDHAIYAAAAQHAGIPLRYGPGLPKQKRFLSGGETVRSDLSLRGVGGVVETMRALLRVNGVSVSSDPPSLTINPGAKERALSLFGDRPRPWYAFGTTCDDDRRRWIPHRYAELCAGLLGATGGTVFFLGGPNHAPQIRQATRYLHGVSGWVDASAYPLALEVSVALLSLADMFVGSDSGPMNIATAVGTPTYGLFGNHKPHGSISPEVRAIFPEIARDSLSGMDAITTAAVMERLRADGRLRQATTA